MNEAMTPTPEENLQTATEVLSRRHATLLFVAILALIILADLSSKSFVFDLLETEIRHAADGTPYLIQTPMHKFFPGFAFEASINLGAFNGWFAGVTWLLIGVSGLSIPVCFWFALSTPRRSVPMVVSLALIAAGAAGNLHDRWFHGGVRDFIRCSVNIGEKEWVWPNFNIADSAIVCGVAIILMREWILMRRAAEVSAE